MKFAVGITVYYPKYEQVEKIKSYVDCFDMVMVVDNTENKDYYSKEISEISDIEYYAENNVGLPKAFNKMIQNARKEKIDFLCILDQDSDLEKQSIYDIKGVINGLSNFNDFGIIAPKAICEKNNHQCKEGISRENWVISSGSFLNLKVLEQSRIKYDENYFVDRCDADFCKQIINNNLNILVCNNIILKQKLGEVNRRGYLEHSVSRNYYMFRDRLYFNKKFYSQPKRFLLNVLQVLKHYFSIIMYEEKKMSKIMISIKAFKDYKNKVIGRVAHSNKMD